MLLEQIPSISDLNYFLSLNKIINLFWWRSKGKRTLKCSAGDKQSDMKMRLKRTSNKQLETTKTKSSIKAINKIDSHSLWLRGSGITVNSPLIMARMKNLMMKPFQFRVELERINPLVLLFNTMKELADSWLLSQVHLLASLHLIKTLRL